MNIYKYTNGKDTITEYNDGNHQEFEGMYTTSRGCWDIAELFESLKESDEDFDESVWLEDNAFDCVEETE